MSKTNSLLLFTLLFSLSLNAQMVVNTDTLYGNEWIVGSQNYYKIPIGSDGFVRISGAQLSAAGIPTGSISAGQYQIFRNGREQVLHISTSGALTSGDFIQFYGEKNRIELDSFLFVKDTFYQNKGIVPLLNPEYSVITDTASYFLTYRSTPSVSRFAATANDLSNLPTAETWFWYDTKLVNSAVWRKADLGSSVYLPEFQSSEGFGSSLTNVNTGTFALTSFQAGVAPTMTLRWAGNAACHYNSIKHTTSNTTLLIDTTYTYSATNIERNAMTSTSLRQKSFSVSAALLSSSFSFELRGLCSSNDLNTISVATMRYARRFEFGNATSFAFEMPADVSAKYLEITQFNHGGVAPVLYDLTNNLRIETALSGATVRVLLPPSVSNRKLVLQNETVVGNISRITAVNMPSIPNSAGNYIILTSARMRSGSSDKVQAYADYRASAAGGGYTPYIVDIEDITNTFGYGVPRHPIAVRNLVNYLTKNLSDFKHFVIIGKGREYNQFRTSSQTTPDALAIYDVPTWGYPGSDILLTAGYGNLYSAVSAGRIAAQNPDELAIYLKKIQDLENEQRNAPQTLAARGWMKEMIHLSGGASEASLLLSYMQQYENVAENNTWSPNITTFTKVKTEPYAVSQSNAIFEKINQGAAFTTFFGHSSSGGLDFDIDYPSEFRNTKKYPLFMALGCSAGNVHQVNKGISENFTFYQDKAMSGFLGTSGLDFLSALNIYANYFYQTISTDENFGLSIGDLLVKANLNYNTTTNFALKAVLQEMTLNGDPALKIHGTIGTDFLIDSSTIKTTPHILNAKLDSFDISVDIVNLGKKTNSTIALKYSLKAADGTTTVLKIDNITPPQYRSTYSSRVPMPDSVALVLGENRLLVEVDAQNTVAELPNPVAENNNKLIWTDGQEGYPTTIFENDIVPVFPQKFEIVTASPVVLKASTADAFAPLRNYVFEIDTTEFFNSPFKQRNNIADKGGVLSWQPSVTWQDSMVYFWRISVDSVSPTQGYRWQTQSFTFINNSDAGWQQSHILEMLKNTLTNVKLDSFSRLWQYVVDLQSVTVKNIPDLPTWSPAINVDNTRIARNYGVPDAGMYVIVFDSLKGFTNTDYTYLNRPPNTYGVAHPQGWHLFTYMFSTTDSSATTGRRALMNYVNNIVPDGQFCLIFTVMQSSSANLATASWATDSIYGTENLFRFFERQGATKIRQMATRNVPYTLFFQKGRNNVVYERVSGSYTEGFNESFFMPARWNKGIVRSTVVGPASAYSRVEMTVKKTGADSSRLRIYALNAAQKNDSLLVDTDASTYNLATLDANTYPYLRLESDVLDLTQRTTPDLAAWRVHYTGKMDLALAPNRQFSFSQNTVTQGDSIALVTAIENVSRVGSDSVTLALILTNANNQSFSFSKKFAPLAAKTWAIVDFKIPTNTLVATKYKVQIVLNPTADRLSETEWINNNADTVVTISSRLATEVKQFEGKNTEGGNILSLKTANEQNVQYHILERSADAFKTVQFVEKANAAGTSSSEQSYTFWDKNPFDITYYRVKSIDFDGKYTYSKVIVLKNRVQKLAIKAVYPQPSSDFATIQIAAVNDTKGRLEIYNNLGQLVHYQDITLQKGVNEQRCDVSKLTAGVYRLVISDSKEVSVTKIVKQ